jgi:hypothetical protein
VSESLCQQMQRVKKTLYLLILMKLVFKQHPGLSGFSGVSFNLMFESTIKQRLQQACRIHPFALKV